jgi:hypothetical protein
MANFRTELKWGLIFAGMGLAWMALERAAGLHDAHIDLHPIYTNFVALPAILIYVLALREKRDRDFGGQMSYGQGVRAGLLVTLVVTLLSPATQYITSTLITPQYFEHAIAYAVSEGKSGQAEAEAYFSLSNYVLQGLIGAPIMGLLTTLVVAAFVRKA